MSRAVSHFEHGVSLIKHAVASLRGLVSEGKLDEKTASLVARLIKLLERVSSTIALIASKVELSEKNALALAPYTYVYRVGSEVILMRSKPEYTAIIIDSEKPEVSVKTREAYISVTTSIIKARGRGIKIETEIKDVAGLTSAREVLRAVLGVLEKRIETRLAPYIESLVKRL